MMHDPLVLALLGTGFTFAATALGAASVFVVRKNTSPSAHKAMLGFAAGVMIAASIWSLLLPAQEMAAEQGQSEWLPTTLGFLAGGAFLYLLDHLLLMGQSKIHCETCPFFLVRQAGAAPAAGRPWPDPPGSCQKTVK